MDEGISGYILMVVPVGEGISENGQQCDNGETHDDGTIEGSSIIVSDRSAARSPGSLRKSGHRRGLRRLETHEVMAFRPHFLISDSLLRTLKRLRTTKHPAQVPGRRSYRPFTDIRE